MINKSNIVFLGRTLKDTLKRAKITHIDKDNYEDVLKVVNKEIEFIDNKNIPLEKKLILIEPLKKNIKRISVYLNNDNVSHLEYDAETNDWYYVLEGGEN